MNETRLTVVGNLVTAVDKNRLPDGTAVANFRIGSTQRRYDRAAGSWVDGDSLYVDVTCWRDLAENVNASLVKGDPVVVTGRYYTRNYEHEGQRRSAMTLEAQSVGADLSGCRAVVTRTRGRAAAASGAGGQGSDRTDRSDVAPASVAPETAASGGAEAPRLVAAVPVGEG